MRLRELMVVGVGVAMAAMASHAAETVRMAIGEWAPFTSEVNPTGRLLEAVVTEAFRTEGITVVYSYFPWKRSYVQTELGEFDGTFPWTRTPEREKAFHISKQSLVKDETVFFHLKTTPFDWGTLQDLKPYRVGVTLGYRQESAYREQGIAAEVVTSEELNFRKMLVGRIDVYQTSRHVGYSTIANLFTPEQANLFTHHPKAVSEDDYFVLFSKKTPRGRELSNRFDAGLKKLKASGAYEKIMAGYRVEAK